MAETEYSLIIGLNGFHLGKTRTIEWHSSLEDATETGGIKLISPDDANHWISFDLAGGYAFRELPSPSLGAEFEDLEGGDVGLFLVKNSPWVNKLLAIPVEDWEDWQDRNRILPRTDIRHLVLKLDRFQLDLLVTQVELDHKIIPL